MFLVLLGGPADPVLHTVQVGQLTENLVVAAEVEGGQRRLDRLPVTRVGRLHQGEHPRVPERAHLVRAALLPACDGKGVRIRRRSLATPTEQLAEHAAPSPGPA